MRRLTTAIAILFAPTLCLAHVPSAEGSLVESLGHQLLSPHHIPLALLVIGTAVALACRRRARSAARDTKRG